MSVFSKNLRYLRESRGLKLDEFEFLGIKKGTMSNYELGNTCLLYTSPSPRDRTRSRMPSSA